MELKEIRNQIDRVDDMLLTSFASRMRLSAQIAEYKKENGLPVLDAEREKEMIESVRKIAPSDMEEECVLLYNKIMEISRSFQEKIIAEK